MSSGPKEDEDMSEVSNDVPPEMLREVADLLFGGGADALVSKFSPGPDDMSTKGMSPERRKAVHNAAMAGNTVATIGGAHAMGMALQDKDLPGGKATKKAASHLKKVPGVKGATKVGRAITGAAYKHPKAAAGVAAGWVGLHGIELLADVQGRMALKENYKRHTEKKPVKKNLTPIAKYQKPDANQIRNKVVLATAPKVVDGTVKGAKLGVKAGGKGLDVTKKGLVKLQKKSFLTPVCKQFDVTWVGEFSKVDPDKRQVFGWASVVEMNGEKIVDLQGDYISIDEIEKSAYEYVVKSRKGGNMHARDGDNPMHASDMIESFIVTPEKKEKMGLPDSTPVGWWVGYQVNDPKTWEMVKSGERTGFSIHGRGQRTDA